MELHGRRQIFADVSEITDSNIIQVLNDVIPTHLVNRAEIQYLYDYLRGKQPILDRVKVIREEIVNKVVVNLANAIVAFKVANAFGDPVQYVSRGKGKDIPEKVERLNSMMLSENKPSKDMQLGNWMFTAGVGYRLVIRDREYDEYDDAPFEIYIPDPRDTFVIRSNDVTHRVLAGVTMASQKDNVSVKYTVYTANAVYYLTGSNAQVSTLDSVEVHNMGRVPLIEYPCNTLRMGAFEVVLPLLDGINNIESNRLDAVEQFVQAIMIFENVDIDSEAFEQMKKQGALLISNRDGNQSKVYYLNDQLDQTQTQTLIEDVCQMIRDIVGMPSQGNANTSDSSNNGAVIMKNGWWGAESRAKETTWMFTEPETEFLKVILKMCSDSERLDLKVTDIELKFSRQNYEDKLIKVQSFTTLIAAGCPPIQAFTISGAVTDPESAALKYEEYQKEREEKALEDMERANEHEQSAEQGSEDNPGRDSANVGN